MKILTFIVYSALCVNAWALGGYGTLSGDEKKLTDIIKTKLEITENDAFRLYESFISEQMNSKNWNYNVFDNQSLDNTKVGKSPYKTVLINFVTDNRYINLSFVKFPVERQVLVQSLETLPRSSQIALDKYNSIKSESAWTVDSDTPEFSTFTKKKLAEKVKILINSGVGGIQYIDFSTFDLKN